MHYKKLIKKQQKISPLFRLQISKFTTNQAFNNILSQIVLNC